MVTAHFVQWTWCQTLQYFIYFEYKNCIVFCVLTTFETSVTVI